MDHIDAIASAATPDAVIACMHQHLESRDVRYYSHRTLFDGEKSLDRATVPQKWLEHYYASGYRAVDPGPVRAATARRPIAMCFDPTHHSYHAEGRAKDMFAELASLGPSGSFFVPFRGVLGGPSASVNFLVDCPVHMFDAWVRAHGHHMHLYATLVHSRILMLMEELGELETGNPLAARERECLQWLARGHRSDRIAEHMGITPRTVEFHLKNARNKLGGRTREHALAKALLEGWIEL